jgi:hypothetical protein
LDRGRSVRGPLLELEQQRSQAHALQHPAFAIDMKPGALTIPCGHGIERSLFGQEALCAIEQTCL